MADLSDVENALVNLLTLLIYPNGAGAESALQAPARVFRGLPASSLLLEDRTNGILDISVFPVAGSTKDTTRWGVQAFELPGAPSLTVSAQGNSASFTGIAAAGDLAGVLAGQVAYIYAAQPGDSAALVAAVLADAIRANTICWLTGATLTLPGFSQMVARTAAPASALEEWGRQEQDFRISVWAPNPLARDLTCSFVSAGLVTTAFLTLADGTGGRLRYRSTASIDEDQGSSIYRRDLVYSVEYATTVLVQSPTVLFGDLGWNGTTILI
jgi:hypothetical protein